MVFIAAHGLVVRVLIAEAALADQPALDQEVQCAVDRGAADGLALLLEGDVQLVCVEVLRLREHLRQELPALPRELQLARTEEALEALLFIR